MFSRSIFLSILPTVLKKYNFKYPADGSQEVGFKYRADCSQEVDFKYRADCSQ